MGQNHSNRIIRKLLFANQDKKQLLFAFFGVLIGFVFMSISIHYLFEINKVEANSEILNSNAVIVQKQVNSSGTLSIGNNVFSPNELIYYRKKSFIDKIEPVENNQFPVELRSDDPLIPYFRSDIFIQSINPDFLDVKSSLWKWNLGDTIVPIILPRDFVYMMNNFLSSGGLPQLSDEILKDVRFEIYLGEVKNLKFKAQIIGFTNEISSILVPEQFMDFGNSTFRLNVKKSYNQIMLKSKKGKFGLVEDLLKRNHLEVKKEQLIEGKLKSILTILLSSISLISIVVVLISVIVLIQYLQLLITRNSYEIRTMLRIGISISKIVIQFINYILFGFCLILFLIFIIDFYLFNKIDLILNSAGFSQTTDNYNIVILFNLITMILIFSFSVFSINKFIKKEF